VVPQEQPTPDRQTILDHLTHITRRWHELDEAVLLETVFLTNGDRAEVNNVAHFRFPDQIPDAADHIAAMNPHRLNAYVTVNPVAAEHRPPAGRRANADAIAASFYHWADADSEEAARNIKSFVGPKPTFTVVTGRQPCSRPHVYWELDEPTSDWPAWTARQKAIAATLKTDPAVVDPPRIMRVAGTVNWPKPKKQAKGYVAETTTLHIIGSPAVTHEAMARAFKAPETPQSGTDWIDTGGRPATTVEAYSDLLRRAATDGEKHAAVRDMTAKMAAAGVPRNMTEAMVRSVCPVWDSNVEKLIATAYDPRNPFVKRDDAKAPQASAQAVEKALGGIITGLRIRTSAEFLSDLTPAVYVVDGVLAERRCLSLTGYAGHGKTTLAMHLAIEVARGGEFGGMECEQGSVLVLAGENPDNVKWQYAAAIAAAECGNDLPIHFLPGHFQLSAFLDDLIAKAEKIPNLRLVIIDSLQAFFEGENDNGNVEMMEAARRFRQLSDLDAGPSVLVIAHPAGKRPDKQNIVPRGGSAFSNELDGNLTVWSEPDGTQVLHHTEKFRGAPFDPLTFVMEDRQFDHLKDHKGRHMRLKVSRKQLDVEAASASMKAERRDKDALHIIDGTPKITERNLAIELKVSKSTARRVLQDLVNDKLIRRHARKWVITDAGKEFLNDA